MGPRWKEAASLDLERDRQRRFAGIMAADESFFDPHELHRSGGHCEVCGRDDANAGLELERERTICASCSDLKRLARRLADAHGIFWAWGQERKTVQSTLGKQTNLKFPALEYGCSAPGSMIAPGGAMSISMSRARLRGHPRVWCANDTMRRWRSNR